MTTLYLYPSGDISRAIPDQFPAMPEGHWDKVADPYDVPDEFTTYVAKPDSFVAPFQKWDEYFLSLPPAGVSGVINNVRAHARVRGLGSGTGHMQANQGLKLGGVSDLQGWFGAGLGWVNAWHTVARPGGGVWTWEDFDGSTTFLLGLDAYTINNTAYCTQCYVEIDYTALPPPPPAKCSTPWWLLIPAVVGGGLLGHVSARESKKR
jgi:hypothetical protein